MKARLCFNGCRILVKRKTKIYSITPSENVLFLLTVRKTYLCDIKAKGVADEQERIDVKGERANKILSTLPVFNYL